MDEQMAARRAFGAHLAALRKRARLTQPQLAARLCVVSSTTTVTRSDVSRWERGKRVPDAWLPSLATALAVPLEELERAAAQARGEVAELPQDDHPHAVVQQRAGWLLAHDTAHGGDHVADAAVQVWRAERAQIIGGDKARLAVVSEVAEIAGWLLFDAARPEEARAAWLESLHLARSAGDQTMQWFAMSLLAMEAAQSGRVGEALSLCEEITDRPVPPRVALLAEVRRSRALAAAGDRPRALQAIGRARSRLEDSLHSRDPHWSWWVDELEVTGHDGEVALLLGEPARAVSRFEQTVGLQKSVNPMGRGALYFAVAELDALVRLGAWREAEAPLLRLKPLLRTVASSRIQGRLRSTLRAIDRDGPAWLVDTAREVAES
ncbi:Helix-turn-helix domain protein [Streptomyces sp. YIM 121038]|uniref:helix-turn-helix domain-containing protein n=1 Tax=Streptomyces sp. YIM 121038 TaxID=2136401 RepID=UPI001110CB03|nr:helix-turn-helix transcriptional regulator [Streptomyces sp. YIM 121038]QCX76759.1 Helix-turn-helix domain protein [Streptomyces sp. YIM 121038]